MGEYSGPRGAHHKWDKSLISTKQYTCTNSRDQFITIKHTIFLVFVHIYYRVNNYEVCMYAYDFNYVCRTKRGSKGNTKFVVFSIIT